MESIIHADIFFFVTTILVVVLTVLLAISSVYIIKIMKNVAHMSETLKNRVDTVDDNLEEIVDQVKESTLFNFVFGKKKSKRK